jgi:DNA replication protein DnaC
MKYFNKRLLDSGIKKKYHNTPLKAFKDRSKKVIPVIRKYLLNIEKYYTNGTGLFIHGKKVSGKTLLANIVALYADAYGFSVLFTNLSDLTDSRIARSDDSFEKAKERILELLLNQHLHQNILHQYHSDLQ